MHLFVRMDDVGPPRGALLHLCGAFKQIAVLILMAFYQTRVSVSFLVSVFGITFWSHCCSYKHSGEL